jgi:hypothetical protein
MDQDDLLVSDGREKAGHGSREIGEGFRGMELGKHRSQECLGRVSLVIASGYQNGT